MTIVTQILLGSIVLGICSMLHIVLLVAAIKLLRRMAPHDRASRSLLHVIKLLVLGFGIVLFAHTLQVWIWALSFIALGTLPNISDAIYFSLVTYTTVGYGDVTVGGGFRVFGAMAAVTGLLNFGLSTAFLVGLFERMLPNQLPPPPQP